jgi:hypothetical protein
LQAGNGDFPARNASFWPPTPFLTDFYPENRRLTFKTIQNEAFPPQKAKLPFDLISALKQDDGGNRLPFIPIVSVFGIAIVTVAYRRNYLSRRNLRIA